MKFPNYESSSIQGLRTRAEQTLTQSDEIRDRDPVVYELRLHELELRMQNEALREAGEDPSDLLRRREEQEP